MLKRTVCLCAVILAAVCFPALAQDSTGSEKEGLIRELVDILKTEDNAKMQLEFVADEMEQRFPQLVSQMITQTGLLSQAEQTQQKELLEQSFRRFSTRFRELLAEQVPAGEVAKEINHLEGYKPKKPDGVPSSIGEELADVIFAIICVSNYYKIDINKELTLTIEKYSKRDSNRFK